MAHFTCWAADAAWYLASGAETAGSVCASADSGPMTKSCAALTGWVTPGILAGANNSDWVLPFWLL